LVAGKQGTCQFLVLLQINDLLTKWIRGSLRSLM